MPTMTAINLPGMTDSISQQLWPKLSNSLNVFDMVRKESQGQSWLVIDSRNPIDPKILIRALNEVGIESTIRAEVEYERTAEGRRASAKDGWHSNNGRLPAVLKDEVTWYGSPDGAWANEILSDSGGAPGDGAYSITIELEPMLYHRLSIGALENEKPLSEFILQVLEERTEF